MECPWCAMEIERGLEECPYCKNRVTVGSSSRGTVFKVVAVLALIAIISLLLGNVLPGLLRSFLHFFH